MRILAFVFFGLLFCGCSSQENFQKAERATDEFHMQFAKASYGEIYDASDSAVKTNATREQMIGMLQRINRKLGPCGDPQRQSFNVNYNTSGRFVTMVYTRKCANGQLAENFVWRIQDGKPILYGYHVKSPALATD
jgi:hypothetical protein